MEVTRPLAFPPPPQHSRLLAVYSLFPNKPCSCGEACNCCHHWPWQFPSCIPEATAKPCSRSQDRTLGKPLERSEWSAADSWASSCSVWLTGTQRIPNPVHCKFSSGETVAPGEKCTFPATKHQTPHWRLCIEGSWFPNTRHLDLPNVQIVAEPHSRCCIAVRWPVASWWANSKTSQEEGGCFDYDVCMVLQSSLMCTEMITDPVLVKVPPTWIKRIRQL